VVTVVWPRAKFEQTSETFEWQKEPVA
jgi:hypothetical protein